MDAKNTCDGRRNDRSHMDYKGADDVQDAFWSEPLRVDNELSNINSVQKEGNTAEKDEATLRPSIQDISSSRKLRVGKPPFQIAREHSIHPSLPSRWRDELADNP